MKLDLRAVSRKHTLELSSFEETKDNWDKETIQFIMANESKVRLWIRQSLNKRMRSYVPDYKADSFGIDDIYHDILVYMLTGEDYDPSLSESIEMYLRAIVKRFCMQYSSSLLKLYYSTSFDKSTTWLEDEYKDFDGLEAELNISKMLKSIAHKRNKYRINEIFDLFDLLFIVFVFKQNQSVAEMFKLHLTKKLTEEMQSDRELMSVIVTLNNYSSSEEILDELENWSYRKPVLREIRKYVTDRALKRKADGVVVENTDFSNTDKMAYDYFVNSGIEIREHDEESNDFILEEEIYNDEDVFMELLDMNTDALEYLKDMEIEDVYEEVE